MRYCSGKLQFCLTSMAFPKHSSLVCSVLLFWKKFCCFEKSFVVWKKSFVLLKKVLLFWKVLLFGKKVLLFWKKFCCFEKKFCCFEKKFCCFEEKVSLFWKKFCSFEKSLVVLKKKFCCFEKKSFVVLKKVLLFWRKKNFSVLNYGSKTPLQAPHVLWLQFVASDSSSCEREHTKTAVCIEASPQTLSSIANSPEGDAVHTLSISNTLSFLLVLPVAANTLWTGDADLRLCITQLWKTDDAHLRF